jgi:hypothetical protein
MNKVNSSLIDVQEKFANSLISTERSAALFSTKPELIDGRFDFYRSNFQAICLQTMKSTFPVMLRLVGNDFFETLVVRHGIKHPSTSGDLTSLGNTFSQFLKEDELVEEYPYFSEVATLEYLVHLTYYETDSDTLSLPFYLQKAGEGIGQSKLVFRPTTHLCHSKWANAPIWLAHQSEEVAELNCSIDSACYSLVLRHQWDVTVHVIPESSFVALSALFNGSTLEDALEKAMSVDADFEVGTQLHNWFELQLFSDFICNESA